jgi:TonB family protein
MITALLLMLADPQAASVSGEVLDSEQVQEIVIIARRARGVRWDWKVDKAGRLTKCKITRSSGDREIDQIGCEATRQCAAKGIRKARQMRACIIPLRRQLIVELAERRSARN